MSMSFNEIELNSLFSDDYRFALETVNYSFIENTCEIVPEMEIKDYLRVELLSESVKLHVGRCVDFIPACFFSAEVGFVVELFLCDDSYEIIKENESKLEARFIEEGDFVLSNIMSRVSLLLAQITSISGMQPLVSSPSFEMNEE